MPIVRDFFVLLILVVVPTMWRLPLRLAHRGALDLIRLGPILLNPLATNSKQRAIRDELRWTGLQVLQPSSSTPIRRHPDQKNHLNGAPAAVWRSRVERTTAFTPTESN